MKSRVGVAQLNELIDCLLAHPNVATGIILIDTRLTDKEGIKLARCVAASFTIERLGLDSNQLGDAAYLALAAALRTNTSLRYLSLSFNQPKDINHIDATFIEALRLNPSRPAESKWQLYSPDNTFLRLQPIARQLGHPTLQTILNNQLEVFSIHPTRR